MPVTIGYYSHFSEAVHKSIQESLSNGFDFTVANLVHPKSPEFVPFTNLLLDDYDYSRLVIFIPKRDYQLVKNVRALERELLYANHIGIYEVVIDCPDNLRSVRNMANVVLRLLTPGPGDSYETRLNVSLKVPITPNEALANQLRSNPKPVNDDTPWIRWNHARMLMQSHSKFSVALEINGEMPDTERAERWLGEPITMVILPTSIFRTNSSNFPVLSRAMQMFLGQVNFRMARKFSFIVKGCNLHGELKHYAQYLNHLKDSDVFVDKLLPHCSSYEDHLQIPLQPLKDNLDSSVYETFETDIVKYQQYEQAILEAMKHIPKNEVTVMVVGAGRGPLVEKVLLGAKHCGKHATVFAVEKNPNAVITLNLLRDLKWGNKKGLPHGTVNIISSDMRNWNAPKKADLVVSELLGSFGDNELSPECLDGVWRYCRPDTISIPTSYSSYLCPLQSQRLHSQLAKERVLHLNAYEYPYVTHIRNRYMIDQPQPVFTFEHHDLSQPANTRDNTRCQYLTFKSKVKTVCHGFAGYFDCCLYGNVRLSIVPEKQNNGMFSWFPIYFPIETPFVVEEDEIIEVQMTRNVNELHVWYEWSVLQPVQTKIHNLNGRHYSLSLH